MGLKQDIDVLAEMLEGMTPKEIIELFVQAYMYKCPYRWVDGSCNDETGNHLCQSHKDVKIELKTDKLLCDEAVNNDKCAYINRILFNPIIYKTYGRD